MGLHWDCSPARQIILTSEEKQGSMFALIFFVILLLLSLWQSSGTFGRGAVCCQSLLPHQKVKATESSLPVVGPGEREDERGTREQTARNFFGED